MNSPISNPSAIKRVCYYVASPVETCDRCGQGIKHVFAVSLKDDSRSVYGSECINKVLAGDTSLRSLWRKNVKILQYRQDCLRVLESGNIPRGQEYYGSGMFFCALEDGTDIMTLKGASLWHPDIDEAKNLAGKAYRQDGTQWNGKRDSEGKPIYNTPDAFRARAKADIAGAIVELKASVSALESFLARVLNAAKAKGFDL